MATLVNILSMGHSGSTMLDLIVGGHSRARSLGEVYVAYYPFKPFHFPEAHGSPASQVLWDIAATAPRSGFHATVQRETGADFLVDSSKNLLWAIESMRAARRSGLDVANILLWKRPETLDYSFWRRGDRAFQWLNRYKVYYRRILEVGAPFVSVSYEDFVTSPDEILGRLGRSIGMPIEPGQERFWDHPPEHLFGNQGTREQTGTTSGFRPPGAGRPPEYLHELPAITERLEADEELQALTRRLAAHPVGGPLDTRFAPSVVRRPWWFYEQKIRRTVRADRLRRARGRTLTAD